MENEKEITKLVNVLRQIRNSGRFGFWGGIDAESSELCLNQYNKIVTRIGELEPTIKSLFTALPEKTSPKTLHFAVSELIAYLTEEKEPFEETSKRRRKHHYSWHCDRKRLIFGLGFLRR